MAALLPAQGAGATPERTEGRPYWQPPTSIDRTGRTDVSEALEHWFSRVPNGGLVLFPPGATYRLDRTVTLPDRRGTEIDGNGSTLRAGSEGDRNRSHLRFDAGSDLRVHDLTIIGANPEAGLGDNAYRADREAQHGVELLGTARVQVDHITVRDVFGDGVYVGRGDDGTFSSQVWIHDDTIERTGRQGVSVTAGRGVVIENNHISETRRSTIDLEPNTPAWGAEDIYIADNQVGRGRLRFVAAHGNGPVGRVVIRGNRLHGRPLTIDVQPEDGARRSDFWVVDNVSDTPADRSPLVFERVDGLVVRNNRQPVTPERALQGEVGVTTLDACGVTVAGNDFGPGTSPLRSDGPPCAPVPEAAMPPVPAIAGRTDRPDVPSAADAGPDRSAAATGADGRATPTTSEPPAVVAVSAPQTSSGRRLGTWLLVLLLAGAGTLLTALVVKNFSRKATIRPK